MAETDSSLYSNLDQRLHNCEQRIGYVFRDKSLLHAALTHASGADTRLASNERLEFLGDAPVPSSCIQAEDRHVLEMLRSHASKLAGFTPPPTRFSSP